MGFTNPLNGVQLDPGATVNVAGTQTTGLPSGTTPSAAIRNVSATSSAAGSLGQTGNGTQTALIVPGVSGKQIELHTIGLTLQMAIGSSQNTVVGFTLEDTVGNFIAQVAITGSNLLSSITLDLEGVTLFAGRGINMVLDVSGGVGNGSIIYTGTVNTIAYTVTS